MKYSASTRLPMRRPCMSVNATTTVSMSPALTATPSCSVLRPGLRACPAAGSLVSNSTPPGPECSLVSALARSPAADHMTNSACGGLLRSGLCPSTPRNVGDVRLTIALGLRVAVLARCQREFLLGGQHQAVASGDGEVGDPKQEVHERPDDAPDVQRVRVERDQRDECDHPGDARAPYTHRAAIGTVDVRQTPSEKDERGALHRIRDHGTEHCHVEERGHKLAGRRPAALADEVHDDGQDATDHPAGDERDV